MNKLQSQTNFYKMLDMKLDNLSSTAELQQFILTEKNQAQLSFQEIFQTVVLKDLYDLSIWLYENCKQTPNNDQFAMESCAFKGLTPLLKYFVDKGLPYRGWNDSIIREAAINGNIETVVYLQSLGADINAGNYDAIKQVSMAGYVKTAMDLIEIGADYNVALRHTPANQRPILEAFKERLDIQKTINNEKLIQSQTKPGGMKI